MIPAVDRQRVGLAFHRQAEHYDEHAQVQKRIVARLDQLIAEQQLQPQTILDVGCGTGALVNAMDARFAESSIYGIDLAFNMALFSATRSPGRTSVINADAENIPFRDESFDLVVSASTFQWLDNLQPGFNECCRVLKKGALAAIAFFGGRTLWELQESYRQVVANRYGRHDARSLRLHRFKRLEEVGISAGCFAENLLLTIEQEIVYHSSVNEMLRSIKAIGAATVSNGGVTGGLGWRGFLNELTEIYESKHGSGGVIPATYEVIYLLARN